MPEESQPEQALQVDPPVAQVAAGGDEVEHQLANDTKGRIAFKVKTSNKVDYRLRPVYGFIKAGQSTPLVIERKDGAPSQDRLVIQFKEAPQEINDPVTFMRSAAPDGEVIVPINAK